MADSVQLEVQLAPGVRIRKADDYDAVWMATRLRAEDKSELEAATPGEPILDILLNGIMQSDPAYVLDHFEEPVLMFGVVPNGDVGVVWAVGTDGIRKVRREVVLHTREWLKTLGANFQYLMNVVDSRNTTHIRWLRWAGAEFHKRITHPVNGIEFLEFSINV